MSLRRWKNQQKVQVLNAEGQVLHSDVLIADSFFTRLRGLLGRAGLTEGEGLLIMRCREIHMWFMRFPIDAVFLRQVDRNDSEHWEVRGLFENLPPWKVLPVGVRDSEVTLELRAGSVQKKAWTVGQKVRLREGGASCID